MNSLIAPVERECIVTLFGLTLHVTLFLHQTFLVPSESTITICSPVVFLQVQLPLRCACVCSANRKCVANIAEAQVLPYLLMVTFTLPSCRPVAMETLHALMANTSIVKEAMQKGALIYMLDLFSNSQNPIVREQAASLFSKMMSDKLIGPKVGFSLAVSFALVFVIVTFLAALGGNLATCRYHKVMLLFFPFHSIHIFMLSASRSCAGAHCSLQVPAADLH